MASFNLHSSRETQTVPPAHAAFCLCLVGIKPLRCSCGSQTLQQFVSERLHRLQLAQGFSQTTLVFAVASHQLFPSLYVLGFGLESTTWAGFPQRSPLCPHNPTASVG